MCEKAKEATCETQERGPGAGTAGGGMFILKCPMRCHVEKILKVSDGCMMISQSPIRFYSTG